MVFRKMKVLVGSLEPLEKIIVIFFSIFLVLGLRLLSHRFRALNQFIANALMQKIRFVLTNGGNKFQWSKWNYEIYLIDE